MEIKKFKEFNEGKIGNFIKAGVASILLLSCSNEIEVKNSSGDSIDLPTKYNTTGVITDFTRIPLGNGVMQYYITVVDSMGNQFKIEKSSTLNFDDSTPSIMFLSNLSKGDQVNVDIIGDECKIIKK